MLETDEGPRKQEQEVRVQERRGGCRMREKRQAVEGWKENTQGGWRERKGVQMGSPVISSPLGEV